MKISYFCYLWGMKKTALILTAIALASCGHSNSLTMTKEEAELINNSPEVMRILTVDNNDDLAILRNTSRDFTLKDIHTTEYDILSKKMVKTLESTESGVGLAAPQIGISRRVVAVMRVDKEGEPIEVYPNLRIEQKRGEMSSGREGCLSVPDASGNVLRYTDITIVYSDMDSKGRLREIREDVSGFAAIIFQHEADHLDGILYTDKCNTIK